MVLIMSASKGTAGYSRKASLVMFSSHDKFLNSLYQFLVSEPIVWIILRLILLATSDVSRALEKEAQGTCCGFSAG